MRLVMIDGVLGNQVFQYIFLRYLEIMTREPCIFEDLFFCSPEVPRNGYELERVFSIDLLPVQEGTFYLQRYRDYQGHIFAPPANVYNSQVLELQGDLHYYGYWVTGHYFSHILNPIVKELSFPPLNGQNLRVMEEIKSAADRSVSVHIRRGDFVTLGWSLDNSFYQKSLCTMRQKFSNPVFFLFSDDMARVREHMVDLGFLPADSCVFVEGNTGANSYIDMQLMTGCKGMIISNSSFSYLAVLLNRQKDKIICNPVNRSMV